MNDISKYSEQKEKSVVERANKMSIALSATARKLAFQDRSRRNMYRLANLSPRTRDRVFSVFLVCNFLLVFLLPFTASVIYYSTFASPKFESSARFVLRSSAKVLTRDRFSGNSALPSAKIIQDTQIVVNFLSSLIFLDQFKQTVSFEDVYGREDIDYFSRLSKGLSKERQLDYWEDQFSVGIKPKSGIVEIQLTAFSPIDAKRLLQQAIQLLEIRVNQMNQGIWNDLIRATEDEFKKASTALDKTRSKFRDIQNATGVFNVTQSAQGVSDIITQLNTEIAEMESREQVLSQTLSPASELLMILRREIDAKEKQSAALSADLAGENKLTNSTFAEFSKLFEQSQLEQELSENRFRKAARELERIKLISSLQLVYLDTFIEPNLPESPKYPRVSLMIFLSLGVCLAIWGTIAAVLVYARTKLD